MKTYIAKTDAEAAALHAGTQTVIVIPFTEQPPAWVKIYWPPLEGNEICCVRHSGESYSWKPPYSPGERIGVKEALYRAYGAVWNYSADCHEVSLGHWQDDSWMAKYLRWERRRGRDKCQAKDMPLLFIRTHLVCRSVKCKPVDDTWKWFVEVERGDKN